MVGHVSEHGHRDRAWTASEFAQLRIQRLGLGVAVQRVIPVHVQHVFGAVYALDLLPVAHLLILPVGQVLGGGSPPGQAACNQVVVGRCFFEDLETVIAHGIQSYSLVGRQRLEKPHRLFAHHGEIRPGEIASVQKQDERVALNSPGLRRLRRAVGECLSVGCHRGCRRRCWSRARGCGIRLREHAYVLLDPIVVDLKVLWLQVCDRPSLVVQGHHVYVHQPGIDVQRQAA